MGKRGTEVEKLSDAAADVWNAFFFSLLLSAAKGESWKPRDASLHGRGLERRAALGSVTQRESEGARKERERVCALSLSVFSRLPFTLNERGSK